MNTREKIDQNIPLSCLDLSIETGRSGAGFLGNLADAVACGAIPVEQIPEFIAKVAVAEAARFDKEARIVGKSVKNDPLAGSASFERNRAQNLRELANILRSS